jgi:hypothetical protein
MSATYVDFRNRKAIMVDDGDYKITLTTVQDLGKVVARALEYTGTWPVVGGISGSEITLAKLIVLGESLRGKTMSLRIGPVICTLMNSSRSFYSGDSKV